LNRDIKLKVIPHFSFLTGKAGQLKIGLSSQLRERTDI